MKQRRAADVIPAAPMANRLKDRGDKTALAGKVGVEVQHVTNWIKRERIPAGRLRAICSALGITEHRYRLEAGLEIEGGQPDFTSDALLRDFEILPPPLQEYVASQAARLRSIVEGVQPGLRALISAPPKDPGEYARWEQGVRELVAHFSQGSGKARAPSAEYAKPAKRERS